MRVFRRSKLILSHLPETLIGIIVALCMGCATMDKCQCNCECTVEECRAVCSSEGSGEMSEPSGAIVKEVKHKDKQDNF